MLTKKKKNNETWKVLVNNQIHENLCYSEKEAKEIAKRLRKSIPGAIVTIEKN